MEENVNVVFAQAWNKFLVFLKTHFHSFPSFVENYAFITSLQPDYVLVRFAADLPAYKEFFDAKNTAKLLEIISNLSKIDLKQVIETHQVSEEVVNKCYEYFSVFYWIIGEINNSLIQAQKTKQTQKAPLMTPTVISPTIPPVETKQKEVANRKKK